MKKIFALLCAASMLAPMSVKAWNVPNESLHYAVNFRWGFIDANAGIATLTTVSDAANNQFTATLTGKSVDILGHYYAVGDTITGTMMADTMQPVYTQHLINENGTFSIETITYASNDNKSLGEVVKTLPDGKVIRSRVSHYGGGLTLDLLSVFYYVRQIDYSSMKPGDSVKVNIFSGKNPETLTIHYGGTQTVTLNGAQKEAYTVNLLFSTQAGGTTNSDVMNLTISTDAQRIPLTIEGSLKIGHMICKYVGDDSPADQK